MGAINAGYELAQQNPAVALAFLGVCVMVVVVAVAILKE